MQQSRRNMLMSVAAAAAMPVAAALADDAKELIHPATPSSLAGKDPWKGLKVGIASYSFRKFPVADTVAAIKRLDLHYVSIKDFHLKLTASSEERKMVAKQFVDAGITPISCGVVSMKDEAAARIAFEYARDIGAATIVAFPEPAVIPALDKLVKEFNINIAIHNHGPEAKHFKSPYEAMEAIDKLDPRVGLCIDVGHTARAGADPAQAIRQLKARLHDVHFKDINDVKAPSAGKAELEVGRGVLDIRSMLTALLEIKYAGHVGFEHEKTAENPLPGLAEGVGYTKGVLSCIG